MAVRGLRGCQCGQNTEREFATEEGEKSWLLRTSTLSLTSSSSPFHGASAWATLASQIRGGQMRFLQKKGGREGGSMLGVHWGWPSLWDPPGPGRSLARDPGQSPVRPLLKHPLLSASSRARVHGWWPRSEASQPRVLGKAPCPGGGRRQNCPRTEGRGPNPSQGTGLRADWRLTTRDWGLSVLPKAQSSTRRAKAGHACPLQLSAGISATACS